MIVLLLLGILLAAESFFLIWDIKKGSCHNREKRSFRAGFGILLILLMLVGVLEGPARYGILAGVLLLQALLGWKSGKKAGNAKKCENEAKSFGRKGEAKGQWAKVRGGVGRALGSMTLYLMALSFAILFPQHKEQKVTGEYQVAEAVYSWVDESRTETYSDTGEKRSVTVKFWYPEAEGSYPLVIFSHGAMGVIDSNYSTCRELASNGYVAVTIAHPYHALFVEDTDGKITMADREFLEQVMNVNDSHTPEKEEAIWRMSSRWLEVRTGDMNFVLDTILEKKRHGEDGPFGKVDPEKIGLFGHSLGGAAAVMTGRQRSDIDAVIDLEGTMLGEYIGYEDGEYILCQEPYPIPLLDVNSQAAYQETCGYDAAGREYVNFHVGRQAGEFKEVVFRDAGHLNFTDLPLVSPILAGMLGTGSVDAGTCIEHVNEMVLEWFDHYLKGVPQLEIPEMY